MATTRASTGQISSKLKETYPPTVYGGMSVDILNMQALFKIFNNLKKKNDDEMTEKVAHTILVHSRLHNSACEQALLPLVKQLSKGGNKMAQDMTKLIEQKEELATKIMNTKKHLKNDEFVKLMQEMESAIKKGAEATQQAIDKLAEELDEEVLEDGAVRMETTKMSASLLPGQMQAAA